MFSTNFALKNLTINFCYKIKCDFERKYHKHMVERDWLIFRESVRDFYQGVKKILKFNVKS